MPHPQQCDPDARGNRKPYTKLDRVQTVKALEIFA